MLEHGTTPVEVKTGYRLDTAAELRQWEAITRLQTEGPWDLIPIFLGAHAVPAEYAGRDEAYVDAVVNEMLLAIRGRSVVTQGPMLCDVFCDEGALTLAQARRILERAQELDFGLKIHATVSRSQPRFCRQKKIDLRLAQHALKSLFQTGESSDFAPAYENSEV
jgi:imidazolonepropionase